MDWSPLLALLLLQLIGLLQAVDPPVFTKPTRPEPIYSDPKMNGDSLVLECQATGNPTPTYWWWRDGAPIAENQYFKINPVSGELTITEFNYRDDGKYMCVATSEVTSPQPAKAVSFSEIQHVQQYDIGTLDSDEKTVNVLERNYLVLPCVTEKAPVPSDVSYKWYNGDESDQLKDYDNGRIFMDIKGNLHFSYVKKTDEAAALYRCGISATWSSTINLGAVNRLLVKQATDNNPIAWVNQMSSGGDPVLRFGTAVLECFFSGYDPATNGDPPTISWIDNKDQPIDLSNPKFTLEEHTRRLTVKGVTAEDEGNFKCFIGNQSPINVPLDVTSPPFFETPATDKPTPSRTLPEGDNADFVCNAVSMPGERAPQTPTWYINGVEFDNSFDANKYQLSTDSKTLTISDLKKPSDTQCVQCKTTNDVGTTWADGCVTVILAIDIEKRPPEKQEIKKGDEVDFTVRSSGDPDTKLTTVWEFANQTFTDRLPDLVTSTTAKDYINTTDLTDQQYQSIAGVYTIEIRNTYESRKIQMEVVLVDEPAPAPVSQGGGFPMWIIIVIIGILLLLLIILCIICVVCRKKQEGDYNVDKKEVGAGLNPMNELKAKGFDDFSRPQDYDEYDYPERGHRDIPFDDEALVPEGEGDSEDEEAFFNEDGSFIGQYHKKDLAREKPNVPNDSNV